MRVKFEVVMLDESVIFVDQETAEQLDNSVLVCFGSLSANAQVRVKDLAQPEPFISPPENIVEDFEIIKISSSLVDELCIQEQLSYQVKLMPSRIVIGPVIGLLVGDGKNKRINNRRFTNYKNIGGLICRFGPKGIDFNNKLVEGDYYNYDKSIWEPGVFPLPKLIYRRNFHVDPKIISKLNVMTNHQVFNSYRFNKFELYQYLSEDPLLKNYLPDTELCSSMAQVLKFIIKHKNIILKPIDLSRGRGICIINTLHSRFMISDYRKKSADYKSMVDYHSLISFLKRNRSFFSKYIIQELIPLAQIDGYPYDIRVVMQKIASDRWKYMGIECRVSRNSLITNISRGGYALNLENAIAKSFEGEDWNNIQIEISDLCHKLCNYIEKRTGEHYAEFGMDIALDTEKKLRVIEVNVLPGFKGFKDIDYDLYSHILSNPLLYAVSLTEFSDILDREV